MSILQTGVQARFNTRSTGIKLMVVCVLGLLMVIPSLFVESIVQDRKTRADDVIREVSGHVGGQQTFLGPTLLIPYNVPPQSKNDSWHHGTYLVFPARATATVQTKTEERRRSLFKVPVFKADVKMDAAFDLTGVPQAAPSDAVMDWAHAELIVGVSDPRGAQADAVISEDGKTVAMNPARTTDSIAFGSDANRMKLALFGVPADALAKPNAQFAVSSLLHFSGAQRLAVLAYGKTTQLSMKGDWPSPGFDGGFLPVSRDVAGSGFTANWSVPFIARGVRAEGTLDSIGGLEATALGTSFIEVADPYQSVERSLKYLPLFIGLVFLSYFVFEETTGRSVHPAQYLLVGIAQLIFYLLLLSFAERAGFDFGFLIGGGATVALLSLNAAWIFASRMQGVRALAIFGMLYGLIYLLLRLEDNALLVGALASFAAVATVMYFTRRIDWYAPFAGGESQTASNTAQ